MKNKLPKQSINFSEWYTQIVKKAGLADYGPVKGTMVIKPYGFQLWDNIKDSFDVMIKKTGHVNAYFPLTVTATFRRLRGCLQTGSSTIPGQDTFPTTKA